MFKALLRKQLRELFGSFTRRGNGKKNKNAKVGFIILYVICFFSLAIAFVGMGTMYADVIIPSGQNWLYYSLCSVMAVALSVFGSSFATYSTLYNAKDNELLLSLPIPPKYILLARSISVYLLGLMFEAVVFIPTTIVYLVKVGANALNVICPIILMFALSVLILCLTCFFGWVIAVVNRKIKNKTVGTVITTILLLGAYYVFYFNAQQVLTAVLASAMNANIPLHIVGDAGIGKVIPLIAVIVIVAILFVITYRILSSNFIKIVTTKTTTKKVEYKKNVEVKQNTLSKTLLKKEIKHLKSSAAYLMNGAFGVLAMPACAIVLLIKAKDIKPLLELVPSKWLAIIAFVCVAVLSSMNSLSAPSISLEGKNFWIIRSLPVNSYAVINSKITLHELFTIPPAMITGIAVCYSLGLDWSTSVNVLAADFIFIVLMAQVGVALNLKMPKLDWVNETQAVKNSIPVLITIFGGWFAAVVLGGIYFILRNMIDVQTYLVALLVALALLTRLLGNWLRGRGVELFEAI